MIFLKLHFLWNLNFVFFFLCVQWKHHICHFLIAYWPLPKKFLSVRLNAIVFMIQNDTPENPCQNKNSPLYCYPILANSPTERPSRFTSFDFVRFYDTTSSKLLLRFFMICVQSFLGRWWCSSVSLFIDSWWYEEKGWVFNVDPHSFVGWIDQPLPPWLMDERASSSLH